MNFRKIILPVASLATLLTVASCGENNNVVVTYHNGEKDEALTVSATSDSAQVAKSVQALCYTAYTKKNETVDLTKLQVKFDADVNFTSKTDEYTTSIGGKGNGQLNVGLNDPNNVKDINELLNSLNLYVAYNGNITLPAGIGIFLGINSSDPSAALNINTDAKIYSGKDKIYVDSKMSAKTGEGNSENSLDKTTKGFIDSSVMSSLLPMVSGLVGVELPTDEINYVKVIDSYKNVYNSLKNYNLYSSLDDLISTLSGKEVKISDTEYEDIDDVVKKLTNKSLEEYVKEFNIQISDVKDNKITFSMDANGLTNAAKEADEDANVNLGDSKVSLTLDASNFLPVSFNLDINSETVEKDSSTNTIESTTTLKALANVSFEYGVDVPTLSDTTSYTEELFGFLKPFEI